MDDGVSKKISRGVATSRPNIIVFGVVQVVSPTADPNTIIAYGRCSSQSL